MTLKNCSVYAVNWARPKLITALLSHFPKYPEVSFLSNLGLDEEQIKIIQEMTGIKITLLKVIDNTQIEEID